MAVLLWTSTTGCNYEVSTPTELNLVRVTEVTLDEPEPPIGRIGQAVGLSSGGFVLVDDFSRRLVLYSSQGTVEATAGGLGEGPSEFLSVSGLVPEPDGGVLVFDDRLSRVSSFGPQLRFDSVSLFWPRPVGESIRVGDRLLGIGAARRRDVGIFSTWNVGERGDIYRLPVALDFSTIPYWSSFSTYFLAEGPNEVALVAASFGYPIYSLSPSGVWNVWAAKPPEYFRLPVVPERGQFSTPTEQQRIPEWLSRFDVITGLVAFQDSLVAVGHGSIEYSVESGATRQITRAVDLYHKESGERLVDGLEVPAGARLLWGGPDGLRLLVGGPPDAWRLLLLRTDTGGEQRELP